MNRTTALTLPLLAALVLPAAASARLPALAPLASTEDCRAEWNASSASRTCDAGVFGRPGNFCRVQVLCRANNGNMVESRYTLDYFQVRNLVNCNGRLEVGGC